MKNVLNSPLAVRINRLGKEKRGETNEEKNTTPAKSLTIHFT